MKKISVLALALLISACSSSEKSDKYYQLSVPSVAPIAGGHSMMATTTHRVWVEPVIVPDYLAGNGIAYQSSDVRYTIATNNLWASPLDQQLQQSLVDNLGAMLPGWLISTTATGDDDATLSVTVTGFQGRDDGHAIITGSWIYHQGDKLIQKRFSKSIPVQKDGYDALVQTLSQGWSQEAQTIAASITRQ